MGLALEQLSEARRKDIAREFFKVVSEDSSRGELIGLCPIHGESNPSFSYNYKKDLFNCLACGATGDLIGLFSEINGFNKKDGFIKFCEKYGLSVGHENSGSASQADPPEAKKTISASTFNKIPILPEAWVKRLVKTRGWTEAVINGLDLRLHVNPKTKEQRIAIPIYTPDGLVNIRKYLPGLPECPGWLRFLQETVQSQNVINELQEFYRLLPHPVHPV